MVVARRQIKRSRYRNLTGKVLRVGGCFAGGAVTINKTKEYWLELCEQVVKQQNPEQLTKLFVELHRILEEKDRRSGDRAVQ